MKFLQLVKYDMYSLVRSPLTYLALVLGFLPTFAIIATNNASDAALPSTVYFLIYTWVFSFIGLLFVIKTITRDVGQGTIQLFMNSKKNRLGYMIGKTISIALIAILMTGLIIVLTLVMQHISDFEPIKQKDMFELLWFMLIFNLFFGILLNFVTSLVPKPALIYAVGVFLIFIIPFASPFIDFIPTYGEKIKDVLEYVPFSYLTESMTSDSHEFTNWQWFIAIASTIGLFIVNTVYTLKKDI